jgi:CDP-diacylglycerol--serine O-phosphatidyltransferase
MNTLKRNIPNLITLSNLFCGCISIIYAFNNQLTYASVFILIGIFLDFFDGFFARILNSTDEFGAQLDSMADLITSGLAPAIILFKLISNQSNIENNFILDTEIPFPTISLIALIIPIFAAIRLSKFNIDNNQKDSFIGLPTPIPAIIIASIPLIKLDAYNPIYDNTTFLCFIAIVLALMMISKLKLFSIKINFQEKKLTQLNIIRLIMLISSLILFLFFNLAAIPFIVVLYITLSIINNIL